MRILLCNDDGIHSAGLRALEEAVSPLGEVYVVAPDREQSASSHALTLHRPLRVEQLDERHYMVDGTPTDCVNLAVNGLLRDRRPDLVLSGINHGSNLGDDITYSGTVSAAMEGTLLGIPSAAISVAGRERFDFRAAAEFAQKLVRALEKKGLPPDTLLNVNVPALPSELVRGVALTRMGKRRYGDAIVEKTDPRGKKYYWIGGDEAGFVEDEGTDFAAVARGMISVTPLHLDLTNYASFDAIAQLDLDWR
ncbi:MAG: 5'-nucleotidase SurE [Candidatus Binatia bacterium]|nr:MAG: 5'-nucleotidase SurE [Candidatus Binatia bacterium]